MARSVDDAGRLFAHRLARKLFGRSGRCLSIRRVYPEHRPHRAGAFVAVIGSLRGPSTEMQIFVTAHQG